MMVAGTLPSVSITLPCKEPLKSMADKPQEHITTTGKVTTTNTIEGFHGLALKYHGKQVYLL